VRRTRKLHDMQGELEDILREWALEQQWKREFEQRMQGAQEQGVHSCSDQDPAASPAYTGSLILAPSSSGESSAADRAREEASLGSFSMPSVWEDRDTCMHPRGPRQPLGPAPEALVERLAARGRIGRGSWGWGALSGPREGHSTCSQRPAGRRGKGQAGREAGREGGSGAGGMWGRERGRKGGRTRGSAPGSLLPHRQGRHSPLLHCMGLAVAVEEGELETEDVQEGGCTAGRSMPMGRLPGDGRCHDKAQAQGWVHQCCTPVEPCAAPVLI